MRWVVQERMRHARRRTDEIFGLLTGPGLRERPIPERHRPIFYLGHLEAFDWNLLCRDASGFASRNAEWERLFAFGIDPVDGGLPDEPAESWPSAGAILEWIPQLRADVDHVVGDAEPTGWLADGWAVGLAIEHRLMHAETLSYMLGRISETGRREGPLPTDLGGTAAPARELISIPAGVATIGLRRDEQPHAGWDNEYERHDVEVPEFRIEKHPVTNADFLRFMEAGAYDDAAHWAPGDWAWRLQAKHEHPAAWRRRGGAWQWRATFGDVPLPPSWPAWVSQAEASAYATWSGLRLPTEEQWHRAALGSPGGSERMHPWGDAMPEPGVHGNFGFASWDPAPVDAHPRGASAFGVHGMTGNGWQWTRTVFAPFPGFEPLPFYPGYSADFFDGRHFVLKGAGPRTDVALLRPSFRNWFQPHHAHVHAGFRCVQDASVPSAR